MKLFVKIFVFLFAFCLFVSQAQAQVTQCTTIGQCPNGSICYGNPYCASGYCDGTCKPFPTAAPLPSPTTPACFARNSHCTLTCSGNNLIFQCADGNCGTISTNTACTYGCGIGPSGSGACNSAPAPTPTTAGPTPTTAPTPTGTHSCSLKSHGDANCDGVINILDFNAWRDEFLGNLTTKTADFNGDGTITILDFNIWHDGFLGLASATPTNTPTPTVPPPGGGNPTSTPVPPTIFVPPPVTVPPATTTPRPPTPTPTSIVEYPTSTPVPVWPTPTPNTSTICGPGEFYYNGSCITNPNVNW